MSIIAADNLQAAVAPEHFSETFWQAEGAIDGTAGGRNLVYFIKTDNVLSERPLVLRHYYRGGLIGKFNKDTFIAIGTPRSVAEFVLLKQMHKEGLPVPAPVAAQVRRYGLFYRADILIERLPCDGDLFTLLKETQVEAGIWHAVGQMIRQFHQAQIFHSDLNCHNILVKQQPLMCWLIDFDKCGRRQGSEWKEQTLARLRRSLLKEHRKAQEGGYSFHYDNEKDWNSLMAGYGITAERAETTRD